MNTSMNGNGSVLLVEDDDAVAYTLKEVLESSDYTVRHARNAAEAKHLVEEAPPDLILLDLMLPDSDGLLLCADLKSKANVPIIICSASEQKRDRILGFKLGADDFIAKPFDVDELLARVEAVLRRATQGHAPEPEAHAADAHAPSPAPQQHRLGELVIEAARRNGTIGGRPLQLTPTEYRLLSALVSRPEEVLSREELAQMVWGYQEASIGRSIDVHIRRLRAKLEGGTTPSPVIVSVRGFGYRIVPHDSPEAQQRAA